MSLHKLCWPYSYLLFYVITAQSATYPSLFQTFLRRYYFDVIPQCLPKPGVRERTLLDLEYKLKELERPKNNKIRWRQICDLCHAGCHMPFKGQLFLHRTLLQVDSCKLMSTLKPCIQVDIIYLIMTGWQKTVHPAHIIFISVKIKLFEM